ncbi:DUF1365 domain-containing protein [Streptomyces hundungensis]|uniref:DUF1365 domain-containing protein n=1 Tax=Streptomyces hundungensis TaxID=1077946 RepID=UPI0034105482
MVTASTASPPAPVRARQVPALYECVVSHARTAPLRHAFQHRTYMWLIDVDDVPVLPRVLRPLARFEARDHFGGADRSLRAGLEGFLAARGVRLDGGRVLMLAHARVLGYVFNPLTLYWCHGPQGELVAVVVEVHNTYGERHCYLLRPDARGLAVVPKEFYVSPFFPVDGTYRMRVPEPSERLDVSVQLHRGEERPFTATLRGARRPATTGGVLAAALRHPWSTAAVSAGIRRHGLWLFLRRLPVRPRPSHRLQEGMK